MKHNLEIIKEINKDIQNKNLLIEGENLEVLDYLKEKYLGNIDIIMIDPPYNTKTELTYKDNFSNEGWNNFMSKRLRKAYDLLSIDGVILINIDEKSHHKLRFIMDDIFGEDNFICDFVWITGGGKNDSGLIKKKTEYIVTYAKNKEKVSFNLKKSDPKNYRYEDERGKYSERGFAMQGLKYSKSLDYIIKAENGEKLVPGYDIEKYKKRQNGEHGVRDWCWTLSKEEFNRRLKDNRIVFKKDKKTNKYKVYYKSYYEGKETAYDNIITDINLNSANYLKKMFNNERVFDYAKPVELLEYLLKIVSKKDSLILDFFAGSGTLGEAVLKINNKDGGNRQFILNTNNEITKKQAKKMKEEGIKEGSEEWEQEGICKKVTFPRLEKVINGYIDSKGKSIKGLGGNLRYIKYIKENNK